MKHAHRSALDEHLPRGWLPRVCLALLLAAIPLAPAAAEAGDDRRSAPGSIDGLAALQAPVTLGNPGDENWATGFQGRGMNNVVFAVATDGRGNLYAGGDFTTAGGAPANHIARWDGASWSALGSGVSGCDSQCVRALAVDGNGNLYAGGSFTTAGGAPANHIARWDGAGWSALGSGMNSWVLALAVDRSDLYAGGIFATAGGVPANSVAKWDIATSSWSALGSGMDPSYGVSDLVVDGKGSLYVGGRFSAAGGVAADRIARWDGTTASWSALGDAAGMDGYVNALALDDSGNLYAGGPFTTIGGVAASGIAKWDSTTSSWSGLGSGMNGDVHSLAMDPQGNLYAGGGFTAAGGAAANYVARWDGASWSALGMGTDGHVWALEVAEGGNSYIGGDFTSGGGAAVNCIGKWNGVTSSWNALGSGLGMAGRTGNVSVKDLVADGNGNLYAGGRFTAAGGTAANSVARWDGTIASWSALGAGIDPQLGVSALAVDTKGNLYAGGSFTAEANYIARWDSAASAWGNLDTGLNDWVAALAVDRDGNLYAGGAFTAAAGVAANYIARWDSKTSSWSALGSGTDGVVRALAVDGDGILYAGGDFTTAGGVTANYVARWDSANSSWSALGSGMNRAVYALELDRAGRLYAGGRFTAAGDVPANNIARWDGTGWSAVGTGMNGTVYTLAFGPGGSLYAGGYFSVAGGAAANYIARWDGAAWRPLGCGTNGAVNALAFGPDRSLYAGGAFTTAGGAASSFIARWMGEAEYKMTWLPLVRR